jgi:2-polyprenyl-3-methyl-5-hydroxy-6-metoxy-1,4-benzoquinol methylase
MSISSIMINRPSRATNVLSQHSRGCPACGLRATRYGFVESCQAQVNGQILSYSLYECGECGTQFADPAKAAPPDWYAHWGEYYGWRWEFDRLLEDLECLPALRKPLKILEVGCGQGVLLERLSQHHDVWGLEFNIEAARGGEARGLRIFPTTVEAFRANNQQLTFDVVAFFQVLEHLEDPEAFLNQITKLLNPGGCVFLSIPNPERCRPMLEREICDYPPHHLTRFSKKGVMRLLNRAGLQVVKSLDEPVPADLVQIVRSIIYRKLPLWKVVKGVFKLPLDVILFPVALFYASRLRKVCTGDTLYLMTKWRP